MPPQLGPAKRLTAVRPSATPMSAGPSSTARLSRSTRTAGRSSLTWCSSAALGRRGCNLGCQLKREHASTRRPPPCYRRELSRRVSGRAHPCAHGRLAPSAQRDRARAPEELRSCHGRTARQSYPPSRPSRAVVSDSVDKSTGSAIAGIGQLRRHFRRYARLFVSLQRGVDSPKVYITRTPAWRC
jgi:hypothetical protein